MLSCCYSSSMQLLLLKEPTHLPLLQHREHYIDGRKVDAKAAVPRDQGGGKLTRKMFVGGIGEVSDAEFQAHFANFGTVTVRSSGSAAGWCGCCCAHVCLRPGHLRCIADSCLTVLCSVCLSPSAGPACRTAWCYASPTAAPVGLGL